MKLSALRTAFETLHRRADRLVQGVVAGDFERFVDELGDQLRRLEAWTKPRAGGSFEVDIEPYASQGGAPAFMRDHAGLLLAAATTLRNARRAQAALRSRPGQARHGDQNLTVPLAAPLRYTGEELGKIQRLFKYLHARRAYRKLAAGEVVVQSLAEGHLPSGVRNIVQLSKHNLGLLRRALAPLSQAEKSLHEALRGLPFRLKHATKAASWANIYSARLIFSKDALADWNIVVPTHTPSSDELYKQDVDFAFFRVEVGEGDWISRFGADDDQQARVVFDWQRLLDDGWVSLHDMLAPLGGREARSELRTREGDELVRISAPDMDLQGERRKWIHWKWKHSFPAGAVAERKVHILDEVFFGPDILEGIVLSTLRDLRDVPALQREAFAHARDPVYGHWLIKSLFRIEAKVPSAFRFEPDEVIRTYGGGDPALRAATDHASSRPAQWVRQRRRAGSHVVTDLPR